MRNDTGWELAVPITIVSVNGQIFILTCETRFPMQGWETNVVKLLSSLNK